MSNSNVNEMTIVQPSKKSSPWKWIIGGILLLVLLTGAGAGLGYMQAVRQRVAYQQSQISQVLDEQFALALKDYYTGKFENAQMRLEAIIQQNPTYPGAADLLTKVSVAANTKDTATPMPTPTLIPTPDTRGVEELLQQAKASISQKDWATAMAALDNLRKEDRTYKTVEVDDLYYVVLRNQGVALISKGSLEMGIYNLSLAERFGYLDAQAVSLRSVAELYLVGASFWGLDWKQAASYFEQVYPSYPALVDSSGMSARNRYRDAMIGYAKDLIKNDSSCKAQKVLEDLPNEFGDDAEVKSALQSAKDHCGD